MKIILFLLAGMVLSIASLAQLSFGIHGTGSLADARIHHEQDFNYNKKMKAMPGGGIDIQYAINKHFALRTGANYVQNGVTLKTTVDETVNMQIQISNRLHYVQVPATLLFTIPMGKIQWYAGAGCYINYGVDGTSKGKMTHTMPDGSEATVIEVADAFKKKEEGGVGLQRSDYGVGLLGGLRLGNGFFANAGYQLSLANIDDSDGNVYRNRSLQITVGMFFK